MLCYIKYFLHQYLYYATFTNNKKHDILTVPNLPNEWTHCAFQTQLNSHTANATHQMFRKWYNIYTTPEFISWLLSSYCSFPNNESYVILWNLCQLYAWSLWVQKNSSIIKQNKFISHQHFDTTYKLKNWHFKEKNECNRFFYFIALMWADRSLWLLKLVCTCEDWQRLLQ